MNGIYLNGTLVIEFYYFNLHWLKPEPILFLLGQSYYLESVTLSYTKKT